MELPMGPRNPVLGMADACGHPQWGPRLGFPWGHETTCWMWRTPVVPPRVPYVELSMGPRSAVPGVADAC
eukprot:2416431-Pyramimonas_sp.AAC.1